MQRKPKVIVYVIVEGHLLVNWHRDHPEAGIQVPGGTINEGETIMAAAVRELLEESGILASGSMDVVFRSQYEPAWESGVLLDRHFVVIQPPDLSLQPFSHVVSSGSLDRGIRLDYFWVPLSVAEVVVGSGHAEGLRVLTDH